MNRFISRPKLQYEYNTLYSLKQPLIYEYKEEMNVINPVDENGVFLFDLASVPKIFQWIHSKSSKQTLYASIVHDKDYNIKKISRLEADLKLLSLTKSEQLYFLEKENIEHQKAFMKARYFITRWLVFFGVRIGGWSYWK